MLVCGRHRADCNGRAERRLILVLRCTGGDVGNGNYGDGIPCAGAWARGADDGELDVITDRRNGHDAILVRNRPRRGCCGMCGCGDRGAIFYLFQNRFFCDRVAHLKLYLHVMIHVLGYTTRAVMSDG